MDTVTIILLIVTILLAIACAILAIVKWKSWSDSEKEAILSSVYALAKTVYDAIKDGKLESSELKIIFNQLVSIIAGIAGRHTDEVEAEFHDELDTTESAASGTSQ